MDKTKDFELFDHTADIGVRAYGSDLPEVFMNAAFGLFAIIFHDKVPKIKTIGEYRITLQSPDQEQLLVDWLNELLYIFSVEHIVFSDYDISITSIGANGKETNKESWSLDATIGGAIVPDDQLAGTREIKAVTYHMLSLEKADVWKAQILFDI